MISLLDINVLIAVVDADHEHNAAATAFLKEVMVSGWATCPLTQNGFIRIVGNPKLGMVPGGTEEARTLLAKYLEAPGHQFWPDDISLMDGALVPTLPASRHLTDLYLLGLAVKHGGRLATFDRRMDVELIPGGSAACHIIPSASGAGA